MKKNNQKEQLISTLLKALGEDPNRDGLLETPSRVVKSWEELFSGYKSNPAEVFKTFEADGYDELVLLKDCEFFSTCEHHMLPFYGRAHIAYIPNKKVIGLSKLARLLEIYSRRLQIQERIGLQVVSALMRNLKCRGAACIIEAEHFCMRARGVEKQNSLVVTSSLAGAFKKNPLTRAELMGLIGWR